MKIIFRNRLRKLKIELSPDELSGLKDYFSELQTNGANPDIEKMTFETWNRPIIISPVSKIDRHNGGTNSHFIYGWFETYGQSDECEIRHWDELGSIEVAI